MLKFRTLLLFSICFCLSIPMIQAQESGEQTEHKVVIIKKIVDQNGEEETIEIELEGKDPETYIIENDGTIEVGPLGIGEGNQIIQIDLKANGVGELNTEMMEENLKIFVHVSESNTYKEISKGELENIDPDAIANMNVEKDGNSTVITIVLQEGNKESHQEHVKHGERPFMGIHMTKELREEDGVEITTPIAGVIISKVVEGSPAEKGGLLVNDQILSIDRKDVTEVDALIDLIRTFNIGDKVTLEILRGQENLTKEIILGARASNRTERSHKEYRFMHGNNHRIHPVVKNPCKPIIGFYHTSKNGETVRVREIISNTPAERQSLQSGDVILEMDNKKIENWKQLIAIRDGHEAGDKFRLLIERNGQPIKIKARFNECDKEEDVEVEVNSNDLIEETTQNLDVEFRAYPNPSTGIVNIDFKGKATPVVISVSDISGKEIYKKELPNFDGQIVETIDLNQEGLNTAIITIQQGDDVFTERIIIQKRS